MRLFALKITIWVLLIGLIVGMNSACGRKGALVLPDYAVDKETAEKKALEKKEKEKDKEKPTPESSPEPQY